MNKTMTKEEYLTSMRDLEEIIAGYREQERQLKELYINENKQFEINEKVKITTPAFRRAIPISFPARMETVGLEAPADCLTLRVPD